MMEQKIPVGISSCLLGEKVRFDGGHKRSAYINNKLVEYFHFHPFCPEMSIGLGVPRQAIRLVEKQGSIICIGRDTPELNVTEPLARLVDGQRAWLESLSGYILKKDSPSCGMERVKVYRNETAQRDGTGIFAKELMDRFPVLPVEEEGRLNDPVLRENFIRRVFVYHQWRTLTAEGLTWKSLIRFHSQLKYVLYSHSPDLARQLGRSLAQAGADNVAEYGETYIADVMSLMKNRASRKLHVNVLQHLQGYLKRSTSALDKRQMCETITQYRLGYIPLIVPLALLRYLFRCYPDSYLSDSLYLYPYPEDLDLLNHI